MEFFSICVKEISERGRVRGAGREREEYMDICMFSESHHSLCMGINYVATYCYVMMYVYLRDWPSIVVLLTCRPSSREEQL